MQTPSQSLKPWLHWHALPEQIELAGHSIVVQHALAGTQALPHGLKLGPQTATHSSPSQPASRPTAFPSLLASSSSVDASGTSASDDAPSSRSPVSPRASTPASRTTTQVWRSSQVGAALHAGISETTIAGKPIATDGPAERSLRMVGPSRPRPFYSAPTGGSTGAARGWRMDLCRTRRPTVASETVSEGDRKTTERKGASPRGRRPACFERATSSRRASSPRPSSLPSSASRPSTCPSRPPSRPSSYPCRSPRREASWADLRERRGSR